MHSPTMPHDPAQPETGSLFEDWFDPIESGPREKVRDFIEEMIRSELDTVLARPRYARRPQAEHADRRIGHHRSPARQPPAHSDGYLRADRDQGAFAAASCAPGRTSE